MDLRAIATVATVTTVAAATACGRSGGAANVPPSVRYDDHVFAGGVAPPAGGLENPLKGDQRSAAEGAQIFIAMNCDGCHGGGALGWVGPSLVDGRWRYGGSDGAVFHSIYYGRPRGMPAYGGILSPAAIWKIVTYLQSQPAPKDVPTEAW